MTNLEKLRAGLSDKLVTIEGGLPTVTIYNVDAIESLMRQAADEIEELRRENARLQVENNRLFNANRRGPL